ncbi:MAG: hydroxymethylglutaryl-CoA lyase [Rhodospirillales bacterium CG15_BIG_FIL_POST_REV_8_21_14_020_66_15]|nr:MAG: hydroxymethylglutaryl-CoA lyase [Rhodospirillales bacterium CG15_BIG_FIL_POST_REV_8_21_14_020_66_15]
MSGQSVTVYEVGPRDGLQNEKRPIPTADKVRLIDLLSEAGFAKIEATSFVSPKWVPQMADAAEVMASIARRPGVAYAALTPNMKGYEGAKAAKADEVAVFAAASEAFSEKNINCTIAESLDRFRPVAEAARADGMPLRGYVSCVTDCPYAGTVPPAEVARVTDALFGLGCYQVSLGDTIGHGKPDSVAAMLDAVLGVADAAALAGHYHDTGGRALDNIAVSLERGIRTFDAAAGGLGGCPYAPGARGNVATGRVVDFLENAGFATGVDRRRLAAAEAFVAGLAV